MRATILVPAIFAASHCLAAPIVLPSAGTPVIVSSIPTSFPSNPQMAGNYHGRHHGKDHPASSYASAQATASPPPSSSASALAAAPSSVASATPTGATLPLSLFPGINLGPEAAPNLVNGLNQRRRGLSTIFGDVPDVAKEIGEIFGLDSGASSPQASSSAQRRSTVEAFNKFAKGYEITGGISPVNGIVPVAGETDPSPQSTSVQQRSLAGAAFQAGEKLLPKVVDALPEVISGFDGIKSFIDSGSSPTATTPQPTSQAQRRSLAGDALKFAVEHGSDIVDGIDHLLDSGSSDAQPTSSPSRRGLDRETLKQILSQRPVIGTKRLPSRSIGKDVEDVLGGGASTVLSFLGSLADD